MVTGFELVSPFLLIENVPRIPFLTLVLNRFADTDARVPSDFAIAASITSAACAAYTEYGSACLWTTFANAFRNALPAPFSCEFGRPATETCRFSAAVSEQSATTE